MKRALVIAVAAASAAAIAAAGPSGASRPHGVAKRGVISFTTKQVHQTLLDHGQPGFGVDDIVVFSNDLFQRGRKIGEHGGTCTVIRVDPGEAPTMYCAGNNTLPGGQISVAGFAAPGAPFELAITGGTGKYRGVHGQVVGRNTSPTEMEISLHVQ